ncbi:MAG: Co2+/Mg2+ efflux protein ApaG [Alphaproteobacteria bacterium]
MYVRTTRSIEIIVEPAYLDDESEPDRDYFFWAYTISIENTGSEAVQLRARHWKITDAHGQTREVHGDGVVGEQPVLSPGDSFEYTSGVPLSTPSGIMVGSYMMQTEKGESFTVPIPAFSLDCRYDCRSMH